MFVFLQRDHLLSCLFFCLDVFIENGFGSETVLNGKVNDREVIRDSDDGHVSPICSLPSSENMQSNSIVSFSVPGEAHIEKEKDNSKSALSSTLCNNRSSYSSLVRIFSLYCFSGPVSIYFSVSENHLLSNNVHLIVSTSVHGIIMHIISLNPDNGAIYDCSVQQAVYHLNFMIGILQNSQGGCATKYV